MIATLKRELLMIDGNGPEWVAQASEKIQLGLNFVLLLPNRPDAIKDFCKVFELGKNCTPAVLTRSALISISLFMAHKDFDYLMEAERRGDKVLFIEQLDLVMNRPPRVQPYMVYCPTWGIISQHDKLIEAKEAYYDYINSLTGLRPHSEAVIYRWAGSKWEMLRFR